MHGFILETGIKKQLASFKCKVHCTSTLYCILIDGFDRVFPMKHLKIFSPYELKLMLCGEQSPTWTREDLLKYTLPKYGYNNDRYVI